MLMTMIVHVFTVGGLMTNCYVASCEETREAVIIDPAFDNRLKAERIFKFIDESALKVKLIVNTHGHPDHTCGNGVVKERFQTPILIHEYDAPMLGAFGERIAGFFGFQNTSPPADTLLHDGDLVNFTNNSLASGINHHEHRPDHCVPADCVFVGDDACCHNGGNESRAHGHAPDFSGRAHKN